jgi:hypothetical protein
MTPNVTAHFTIVLRVLLAFRGRVLSGVWVEWKAPNPLPSLRTLRSEGVRKGRD